ncbi:hypothetical protein DFH09DRAFT_1274824 [Mycena vulgaris]|nr:hypothetical protein DFH09DRAFT_1274824 [Mycena vulgaris]
MSQNIIFLIRAFGTDNGCKRRVKVGHVLFHDVSYRINLSLVQENISPIKPATPLARPKKYKPKLKMNDDEEALEIHQELIGLKRKTVPIPEDNSRPPKKAKTSHADNALPPPPPPPPIATFSPLTRADLPDTCPDASCKDLIPQNLSPTILTLFTRKRDLVTKDGPKAPGCQELTQKICEALRREAHLVRCVKHARQQGWPRIIDFDELPAKILDLLPTLRALLLDSDVLAESPVWTNFLHGIGYKVFAFSKSAAKFDTAYLGCGYFGPRGQVVIQKTLLTLLSDIDGVHTDLYNTLSRLIDAPKRWDSYDDSSNLISVTQFTKFVSIPHAALMLISDDLEIGVEESFEVLQGSREYGTLFNTEKSAERQHMDAPKIAPMLPLRHRKAAVNLLLPPQKMITLDDFPAPKPKSKAKGRKMQKPSTSDNEEPLKSESEMNANIERDGSENTKKGKMKKADQPRTAPQHKYSTRGSTNTAIFGKTPTIVFSQYMHSQPMGGPINNPEKRTEQSRRIFEAGLFDLLGGRNGSRVRCLLMFTPPDLCLDHHGRAASASSRANDGSISRKTRPHITIGKAAKFCRTRHFTSNFPEPFLSYTARCTGGWCRTWRGSSASRNRASVPGSTKHLRHIHCKGGTFCLMHGTLAPSPAHQSGKCRACKQGRHIHCRCQARHPSPRQRTICPIPCLA